MPNISKEIFTRFSCFYAKEQLFKNPTKSLPIKMMFGNKFVQWVKTIQILSSEPPFFGPTKKEIADEKWRSCCSEGIVNRSATSIKKLFFSSVYRSRCKDPSSSISWRNTRCEDFKWFELWPELKSQSIKNPGLESGFFLLLVLFIYAKNCIMCTNTQFLENFERGFTYGYTVAKLMVLQVPLVSKWSKC